MSTTPPETGLVTGVEPKHEGPLPRWVLPVLIGALVVGLAGLGVGLYAVATTPGKTSGPTGAIGPTGKTGPAGAAGAAGPAGPAGPAGSVATTSVVTATTVTSAADAAVGTVLTAKTSCPTGKLLLGGGAQVAASNPGANQTVALSSSFPLSDTVWQTQATVIAPLTAGVTMSMKPYVLCGGS